MKYSFNKRIFNNLLILTIVSFASFVLYFVLAFYPFNHFHFNVDWLMPIFFLLSCLSSLILLINMKGLKPKRASKILGGLEIVVLIAFGLVFFLYLSFLAPVGYKSWPHYLGIGLTLFLFVFTLLSYSEANKLMKKGLEGYLPIRNYFFYVAMFEFAILLFFIIPFAKYAGFDAYVKTYAEDAMTKYKSQLSVWTFIQILLYFIIALVLFYCGLASIISGVENEALNLRGNIKSSTVLFKKYNLAFWFGMVGTFFMLATSIVAVINFGLSYISLLAMYAVILLVKLPSFFWKRKIFNSKKDPYHKYCKEHGILIYSSIILLIFAVIIIVFGSVSLTKVSVSKSAFATFFVFVPWAIFKLFSGFKRYALSRKIGDPYLYTFALLDIFLALFTFTNVLFIVFNATNLDVFVHVAVYIVLGSTVYVLYIAIRLFVLGIRGMKNKRQASYKRHKQYYEQYLSGTLDK